MDEYQWADNRNSFRHQNSIIIADTHNHVVHVGHSKHNSFYGDIFHDYRMSDNEVVEITSIYNIISNIKIKSLIMRLC